MLLRCFHVIMPNKDNQNFSLIFLPIMIRLPQSRFLDLVQTIGMEICHLLSCKRECAWRLLSK